MPRDEVDSSLIVDGPRKRKLAPYATNEDNCSADMNETVKRMKKNAGLMESQTSVEQFDDGDEGTHPRHDTSSLGSRNPPGGTWDGSKSQSRSHRGAKASGNRTRGSAKVLELEERPPKKTTAAGTAGDALCAGDGTGRDGEADGDGGRGIDDEGL